MLLWGSNLASKRKSARVLQVKLPVAFEMPQVGCTCCPSRVICDTQRKSSRGSIYSLLCKQTGSCNLWSNSTAENVARVRDIKQCQITTCEPKIWDIKEQSELSQARMQQALLGSAGRRWGWQVWGHASPCLLEQWLWSGLTPWGMSQHWQ